MSAQSNNLSAAHAEHIKLFIVVYFFEKFF